MQDDFTCVNSIIAALNKRNGIARNPSNFLARLCFYVFANIQFKPYGTK